MDFTYTIDEILAISDDALVQYIIQNRDSSGAISLDRISGAFGAPIETQQQLWQRLGSVSKKANETSFFNPDQLSARLADVAHERDGLSAAETVADTDCPDTNTTVSQSETPLESDDEIECYYRLRGSGARPACSLETFQAIRQTPECFQHILGPWESITGIKDSSTKQVKLFSLQFHRWKTFLSWQYGCRGRTTLWDNESSFDSVSSASDIASKHTLPNYIAPATSAFLEYTEKTIEKYAMIIKLPDQDSQAGRSKAVHLQSKLTGVDEEFTLREDPTEQNVLDSWIEYLIYETINRDSELSHVASSGIDYESEIHRTQTLSDSWTTPNENNEEFELLQFHSDEARQPNTITGTITASFAKTKRQRPLYRRTTSIRTTDKLANDISTVEDVEPEKSQEQKNAQIIIDWIIAELPIVKESLGASRLALMAATKRKRSYDDADASPDQIHNNNIKRGRENHLTIPVQPNYDPEYPESKKRRLSTEC